MINQKDLKDLTDNFYKQMYLRQKELTEKSLRGWKNALWKWRNCNNTWFIMSLLIVVGFTIINILT